MKRSNLSLLACAACLAFSPAALLGQTIDFTASSPGSAGGPVDATAVFTETAGQIVVVLTDDEVNVNNAGQEISDITFTLSSGTYSGASLSSSSAEQLTVNSSADYASGGYTFGSTGSTDWALSGSSKTYTLNGLVGGQPSELIIGPPGGSGATSAYTGSGIASTENFNPQLYETATFTLDITGVTAGTTATGATMSFGTGPDAYVPGVITAPESGAGLLYLLLAGTSCLMAFFFRNRNLAAALPTA